MQGPFKLIVGLGNPGKKYERTRHNLGFRVIDQLVSEWQAVRLSDKHEGEVYSATLPGEETLSLLLIKPQTYMNLSGKCVAPFVRSYLKKIEDLVVIHDDLDLKAFTLRIKCGGGTAGHNGLRSLLDCLGKEKTGYYRIRMGIGRPSDHPRWSSMAPVDYVLARYSEEEEVSLQETLHRAVKAIELLVQGKVTEAMNQFHSENHPHQKKEFKSNGF